MNKKYLFTPGPVKMSQDVLEIGALQTPYCRNEDFSKILLDCEEKILKFVNAPQNSRAIFLAASGTGAMEASVTNLVNPHDKTIIVNGGGFGKRFSDICQVNNIEHKSIMMSTDNLSDTKVLDEYHDYKNLLINAHETTTGLLYNLYELGKFTKKNKIFTIVDAISMFLTDELNMIRDNIDAVIISSQKALALPPGLSIIIVNERAIKNIIPPKSLYFNLKDYLVDGLRGQTPYTPAITIIMQLHKRLTTIDGHGVKNEIRKVRKIAEYFRASIKPLPLKIYQENLSNSMTPLMPTDGRSAKKIVSDLESKYGIIVAPNGGNLSDKLFRVSHMGAIDCEYMDILINALFDYYGVKK